MPDKKEKTNGNSTVEDELVQNSELKPQAEQLPEKAEPSAPSMPSNQKTFDHANYRRDLETLLKYAYDEYRHIGLERQRSQLTYIRHYLWFAALLIGSGAPLFWFLKDPIQHVKWLSFEPGVLFYIACFFSIGIALSVLALGIDSLRGRDMTHLPFGKFMDHAQTAYECALDGSCRPTVLTSALASIDYANGEHIQKIHRVGLKLRWMSRLLLASLGCGVIAVLSRITI